MVARETNKKKLTKLAWQETEVKVDNNKKQLITCFIVTAGRQSLSSSRSDKHTVPEG